MGHALCNHYVLLENKSLLRADRKYHRLHQPSKIGGFFSAPRPPVSGFGCGCTHPADPTACGKSLRGAAAAPANLSPDLELKPVANPISLAVSACNCGLPRYLQAFGIDEGRYTKVLKAGWRAGGRGILEKSDKALCLRGNH